MKQSRTESQVLFELIESLTQAIGATSQLVHLTGNPIGFITIRDALSLMKDGVIMMAPENQALVPKTVFV